ncbi:hypothetical protein [Actinokineospora sp. NBRC 105648]|uniref:hypothetical protein n=1 Tax=Actinokineospora sp. NBRC 105648 TaxID=3032206 RepID=UPI0024A18742|nr:hypothetical protein [Actinokineospora sp. NBRC 105648]GLZ42354.1 hypothetical protein Acsp05_59780 [Actinokineospora sp. NBRC 105648]
MVGRALAVVFSGLLVCAAAGCGSDSPAPAPQAPAVGWVDRVCQAVEANGARLSALPPIDPGKPAEARDGLLAFLGTLSEALTSVNDGITGAGAPPVANGGPAVDKALAGIDGAKTSLDSAKSKLAAIPVTDPVAFQAAITELGPSLGALTDSDGPLKDLRENPEINDAYAKAPTCRKLDGTP